MEIIKKTNIDFLGMRRVAFGVSTILALLGIICVFRIATGKANLGIDFAGGASANMILAKPVKTQDVRKALDAAGFKDASLQVFEVDPNKALIIVGGVESVEAQNIKQALDDAGFKDEEQPRLFTEGDKTMVGVEGTVTNQDQEKDRIKKELEKSGYSNLDLQSFTGGTKLLVRIKETKNIPVAHIVDRIDDAFIKAFPDNPVTVDSSSAIGPTIGKALQKDALLAISIALLGIIIYIAWRFEFKFGLAATIATFHDVLAVLGLFFVLNKEITLLVVTALLTIAGYSLTDTVVVFDRIRENLKLRQKDNLIDIINSSINEVLSRTVVTSLTTFLTVLSLFLIGGQVLHDFAFAMMAGIIVGTYSSVFVASPLLFVWRGSKGGKLIKAAMLSKQPEKAGAPKPVIAEPVKAAPEPAKTPPAKKEPGAGPSPAGKKGRKGKKSYKRGKKS